MRKVVWGIGTLLGIVLMLCVPLGFGNASAAGTLPTMESATGGEDSYSSLAGLVGKICQDAGRHFQGFFGPTVVEVEPFRVIRRSGDSKTNLLGVTLSDEMRAMINNTPLSPYSARSGAHPQKLNGVLQEIDGYLRVHVSGVNHRGARRSFVVNVEMSEAIYRTLLTSTW